MLEVRDKSSFKSIHNEPYKIYPKNTPHKIHGCYQHQYKLEFSFSRAQSHGRLDCNQLIAKLPGHVSSTVRVNNHS